MLLSWPQNEAQQEADRVKNIGHLNGIHAEDSTNRCGDADSAIRQCIKSERVFPYAVSGRCLQQKPIWQNKIQTNQRAGSAGIGESGAYNQPPG